MRRWQAGKSAILFNVRRSLPTVVFFLLFAATLVGNWGGLRDFVKNTARNATEWNGRAFHGNGEHTDALRELAEQVVPPGEAVYYCVGSADGSLQPAERSIHLALSWARSPVPVRFGNPDGVGDASVIIVSRFLRVDFPRYRRIAENDSAVLWRREDIAADSMDIGRIASALAPWREAAGVVFVCALVGVFVWWMRPVHMKNNGRWSFPCVCLPSFTAQTFLVACIVAFFVFAATAALTHTFLAPTGLGVYGGKARLLYLNGGIPDGFFSDPAFSSYQPAYPPGLALLTLLSYWMSGGCGEWLTQLIPVFATAAVLWLTAGVGSGSRLALLWIFVAFLNKQTLQMATLYYAEPFVALLALLGWMRLREDRDDLRGWMLLGATGLFKTEGLILLFAMAASSGIVALFDARDARECVGRTAVLKRSGQIAAAATLPLAWHVGCRMAGASFYDYAPFWAPDWAKFSAALAHLLKTAFLEPWRHGFAYPIAAGALATHLFLRRTEARGACSSSAWPVAALAALLCLVAFAFIYSLSRAPSFFWHLETSAARLLWAPSLLVLAGRWGGAVLAPAPFGATTNTATWKGQGTKKQRPGPFFSRMRLAGLVLRSRDGCAPSRSERLRVHSATDGNLVSLH